MPGGEGDLRRALFDAVSSGDIEIVGVDDQPRQVVNEGHINLGSTELRIRRPEPDPTVGPNPDDPPPVIDPPDPPPPAQVTEFRVSASATQSLRDDDSPRDTLRQFFQAVANAVDDDAAHIQVSLTVTAGTFTKDKLTAAAKAAGIHFDAAEL